MNWTARQRAILAEMGLRIWSAPEEEAASAEARQPAAGHVGAAASAADLAASVVPLLPVEATPPLAGRPAGIAAMDWPALREAVASCTACSLCRGRTNTVFGTGNPGARWMIVGEAPGEQEDLRGEPFVGKSGQLLDSMLRALQLTREDDTATRQVYIANTLKCRPPANRNPEPGELAQCEPFLVRQIELVRPEIILAMGRFAVQALLRSSEPVGRLRGRVHRYHGVPLVVTYHPAYLLRNPQDKARAWDDLCLAREAASRQPPP
jgi:uracil-DNA glycosylase